MSMRPFCMLIKGKGADVNGQRESTFHRLRRMRQEKGPVCSIIHRIYYISSSSYLKDDCFTFAHSNFIYPLESLTVECTSLVHSNKFD